MSATTSSTKQPRRTQAERVQESSRRLLLAAMELIAEKGFERTTAAEIGERAGYSRAMVRDRYGSKEALLEALMQEGLASAITPDEQDGLTGLERIVDQVSRLEAHVTDDETVARAFYVLTFETAGPVPHLRPWFKEWFAAYEMQMKDSLRLGQQDGTIRAELDLDTEAKLFISHAMGLAYRWALDDWNGFDYLGELKIWRGWLERHYARVIVTGSS